jgi:WD repeat-containing protein 48
MIKAVKLSSDGMLCISAGSDNTIRLWDIGLRKCLKVIGDDRRFKQPFPFHKDSIWVFEISSDFNYIYTGGRDGHIFKVSIVEAVIEQVL